MVERMTAAEFNAGKKPKRNKPRAKTPAVDKLNALVGKVQSFSVPFPPAILSPNNDGGNKFARYRAKTDYRTAVWGHLVEQKVRPMADAFIGLEMTFYPPANYGYDDDGLVGLMKAGRDEIARFIGVDDNVFSLARPVIAGAQPPLGRVQITLRPNALRVPVTGSIT